MFDKLVESTSTGADVKPRRRIFGVAALMRSATLSGQLFTRLSPHETSRATTESNEGACPAAAHAALKRRGRVVLRASRLLRCDARSQYLIGRG